MRQEEVSPIESPGIVIPDQVTEELFDGPDGGQVVNEGSTQLFRQQAWEVGVMLGQLRCLAVGAVVVQPSLMDVQISKAGGTVADFCVGKFCPSIAGNQSNQ